MRCRSINSRCDETTGNALRASQANCNGPRIFGWAPPSRTSRSRAVSTRCDRFRRTSISSLRKNPSSIPDTASDLDGIEWVIGGGESGIGSRRCEATGGAQSARDICVAQGVAFFWKQWGGRTPRLAVRSSRAIFGMNTRSRFSPLSLEMDKLSCAPRES